MIDKIIMDFSKALKRKYPNELPEVETLNYVHKFIVSNIIPIIIILLIGIYTNRLEDISLSLFGFAILRGFSGGIHLKSFGACFFISTILIIGIPFLGNYIADYSVLFTVLASLIVGVYAPSNIRKQTLIPEKYFIYLKIISTLIVLSNLLIRSDILTAAFFVQALTLIRLKGGEKK